MTDRVMSDRVAVTVAWENIVDDAFFFPLELTTGEKEPTGWS